MNRSYMIPWRSSYLYLERLSCGGLYLSPLHVKKLLKCSDSMKFNSPQTLEEVRDRIDRKTYNYIKSSCSVDYQGSRGYLYISYLGMINYKHYFKYGITHQPFRRFETHSRFFDTFEVLKTYHSVNNLLLVEKTLRGMLYNIGVLRSIKYKKKHLIEIFSLDEKEHVNHILSLIDDIIKK
jgi:hypothetical protein